MTCIFCTKKTPKFQNPDRDPVLSSVELLSFFYRKLGIEEQPSSISSFQDIPNCFECYLLYAQLNEVYLQLQTLEERAQRISHELQKRVVDSVTLNERSKGRGRTKQFRGQILQSYSKIHKPSNVDERIDVSTTVGDEDVSCEASWDAFDAAIETFFDVREDPPIDNLGVNSPRVSKRTRKRKLVSPERERDALDAAVETSFNVVEDTPIDNLVVNPPRLSKRIRKRKLISPEPARSGSSLTGTSTKSLEEQYGLISCTVRLTKWKGLEYSDNVNVPPAPKCRRGRKLNAVITDDLPNFELALVNLKQEEVEIKEESLGYDGETVSLNDYPVDPLSISADGETYEDSGDECIAENVDKDGETYGDSGDEYMVEKDGSDEETESSDPSEIEHSSEESWCSEVENTKKKPKSGRKSTINSNRRPKIRLRRLKSNAEAGKELEELTTCPVCHINLFGGITTRLIHVVHMHELRVGEEERKTSCSSCDKQYFVDLLLKRHEKTHTYSRKKSFFCDYCSVGYLNADDLQNHLKIHLTRIANAAKSKRKKKSYLWSAQTVRHSPKKRLKSKAEARKELEELTTCPVCEMNLTGGLSNRLLHLVHVHELKAVEETRKTSCSRCDKQYFVDYRLKRHEATHDYNQKKCFFCEYCSVGYLNADDLEIHLNVHSMRGKSKKSKEQNNLWPSEVERTAKPQIRHLPRKRLKSHAVTTKELEELSSCPVCEMNLTGGLTNRLLHVVHMHELRAGEDASKTSCSRCDKQYFVDLLLKRHEETHNYSQKNSFFCDYCSAGYVNDDGLQNHLKAHLIRIANAAKSKRRKEKNNSYPRKVKHIEQPPKIRLQSNASVRKELEELTACPVCHKKLIGALSCRLLHVVHMHELRAGEEERKSCSRCDKQYAVDILLRRHEATHDSQTKTFYCDYCSAGYLKAKNHQKHLQNHLVRIANYEKSQKKKEKQSSAGKLDWECQDCSTEFATQAMLIEHDKVKHPEKYPHICEECDARYSTEPLLETHTKTHGDAGPYDCLVCSSTFENSTALWDHLPTHTGEFYKCKDCNHLYKSMHVLSRHKFRVHKIQPESKLECPDCGKFFLAQSGLNTHIRSTHLGKRWVRKPTAVKLVKKKFPCPKCVQVLNGYKQWLEHQKTSHSEYSKPKMVECEVCKKLINVRQGPWVMMRHLLDCHESLADEADKSLQCKVCQKKFQLQVLLERHEGFHQFDKTKPLFCEVCDIRFLANDAGGLANHIATRHKSGYTKFLCQACPASFFNRRDLMIHFQKQHPELLIHHCTTCGKKFACEELFKSHVKIHSEKGPYDCSYCKQEFGTANALEVHLKSHIGESREVQNRVLCQVCGESCKDEKALERHSNKVHSCTDSSDGQY